MGPFGSAHAKYVEIKTCNALRAPEARQPVLFFFLLGK